MIKFVPLKALAGYNYVRVDQVIAVQATEPAECLVMMAGGVTVPCRGAGQGRPRQAGGGGAGKQE